jgi:WD40 repeat protein
VTPQRYQRLCELFDQAQALPPAGHAAFLEEACAADPSLRPDLDRLLAHDRQARGEALLQGSCPVNAKALLAGEEPVTLPGASSSAAPGDALVGRRVGPYLVEQRLGQGGMGSVYRARREDAYCQLVALKVIRPGLDGEEMLTRFRTERQVLADLEHPHIARLLDGGTTEDGRPYFVMEYIDGQPLDRYCEQHQLGTRERLRLLQDVCAAVQYAHGRGVLHRDLKPANVLVTADGTAKVTDFGLAKRLEGADGGAGPTQSGAILGTPSYMAPEQAAGKGKAVGPATDVYALGAVLYELLAGRPPFRAETPLDTLLLVLEAEPVPPSRLHPGLARDLETVCLKCLQKDPAKRYASVAALAEDLRRFQAGEPIQARPVGRAERLGRWCRRHPARAAAAGSAGVALLAMVALAVGAIFTVQLRREEQRTREALQTAERYRAQLALERGLTLCEQGDVGRGMLCLTQSLAIAPAQDADLRTEIRANLAGWRGQVHPLRAVLSHPDFVRAVAFSPDGQLFLTACWDNTARLWKTSTGEPVGQPWPHPDRVMVVAFSPVSRIAATACRGGSIWLWDLDTGRPLDHGPMRHEDTVWSLVFSADGKTLLTGSRDKTARLWDVATGKPVGSALPHGGDVFAVAFCPDGKSVVTAGEGAVPRLWDAESTAPPRDAPWGHSDFWVSCLAFSPDGKTVVTGTATGAAQLWDVGTGRPVGLPLRHQMGVWAVAFSPDGKSFATGGRDGFARLWETATGKPLGAPLWHQDQVAGLAFSPDGRRVLTASVDHTARLWDISPAQSLATSLPDESHVAAAVFSPDGKTVLASSQAKTARLWDAQTGKELLDLPVPHQGFVFSVAFRPPDGKAFATSGSEEEFAARIWETATGRPVTGPLHHDAQIWVVAFRPPDGKALLTASRDKTVKLWESGTGKPLHTLPHDDDIWAVAFSPGDGKIIATACEDNAARLWDADTGELLHTLPHEAGVNAVAFSPDGGRVLTASTDRTARLWDAAAGRELWHEPLRHQGTLNAVAFSPDGQTVVTTSSDWTARLWEAATGRPIGQPMQHQGSVTKVAFSPDGQLVVTGSMDETARLWLATTGKPFGPPLRHEAPVLPVSFSPDGQTVLTGSWKKALLWKLPVPLSGEVERIAVWTQVMTGLELDADGVVVRVLDAPTWQQRRRRLEELGGPPRP